MSISTQTTSLPDTPNIDPLLILGLYRRREEEMSEEFRQMRDMQQIIYGQLDLPTTEMMEEEKSAVPNLAKVAMQQLSRRTVSVMPDNYFPATSETDEALADARKRTRIVKSWHRQNHLKSVQAQRARWFYVYGKAPVLVIPDKKMGMARWKPINPLNCYYAPLETGEMIPRDVIIESTTTYGWIEKFFPEAASKVYKSQKNMGPDGEFDKDAEFTLLRYVSAGYDVLVLKGQESDDVHTSIYPDQQAVTLAVARNLANRPLVVIPSAISLDHSQGQFDDIGGMYQAQSMLMALQLIAQKRAVFPREWLESNPGEEATVLAHPRPEQGKPGRIRGGKITQQKIDPSIQTLELADRIEYASRMTAGIPPEFGGQGATNVRTARRGGQVIGQTVDFTIAEAQDLFAEALNHENKIAIAIDKAYFGGQKKYFISSTSFSGTITYTPDLLWTTDEHITQYPMSGTDAETLVLTIGQRMGMGSMSQQTAMSIDPLIEDPDVELKRIELETVKRGMMASLEAQAQNPEGPYSPLGYAELSYKMKVKGLDLEDALLEMQQEAQERQAAEAEATTPEGTPNPAMMQGMGLPGEPVAEQGAIPEVQPSQQHLAQLLGSLYTTQAATKSRAPVTG